MVAMSFYAVVVVVLALWSASSEAFRAHRLIYSTPSTAVTTTTALQVVKELKNGDTGAKLVQLDELSNNVGKFQLEATLEAQMLNDILKMYKEELVKKKVKFPGFRPGNIPPSAMPDIKRYIVSFALETMLGELCNLNAIKVTKANHTILSSVLKHFIT